MKKMPTLLLQQRDVEQSYFIYVFTVLYTLVSVLLCECVVQMTGNDDMVGEDVIDDDCDTEEALTEFDFLVADGGKCFACLYVM